MKPEYELWRATVTRSIVGPVVPVVRRVGGPRLLARQAPDYVREFLTLPASRTVRPTLEGFNTWAQVEELKPDPEAHLGGITEVRLRRFPRASKHAGQCYEVRVTFRVKNPAWRAPRPKYTVREHGPLIRTFFQLLDFFGAEAPRSLNHRIYKDTECGASISVLLEGPTAMGTWVHNGDKRWDTLTGAERLRGFTVQTIVEGSEATVDSDLFELPVPERHVKDWLTEMELQADDLWQAANKEEA